MTFVEVGFFACMAGLVGCVLCGALMKRRG